MAQPPDVGSSIHRDLGHKLSPVKSILSIVGNDTTDGTGTAVDLRGYEGAQVIFNIGNSGDTLSGSVYMTLTVQDSADGSTGWANLAASKFRVDSGNTTIDDASEDSQITCITVLPGTTGVARYIRPLVTFTGTHTNGTPISAVVVRGFARKEPAGV